MVNTEISVSPVRPRIPTPAFPSWESLMMCGLFVQLTARYFLSLT